MRHVYIREIIGLIWLAAAIVSGGVSGNFEMSALYVILGGVFLYSDYATWKIAGKGKWSMLFPMIRKDGLL